MNINHVFVGLGVVCVLTALAGGGVKALGSEMPVISSVPRQVLVAAVGVGLIIVPTLADREAKFRVTALRTEWNDATTFCGRKVEYTGFITVAGGGGVIEYRFRLNGSPRSIQTLKAASPQTYAVSGTEYISAVLLPLDHGPTQLSLEVLEPNYIASQPSRLKILCPRV